MTGNDVRVDTTDLRAKATQIRELHLLKMMMGGVPPQPPDALTLSKTAVDNLRQNAQFLVLNQMCGSQEGDRLAESLDSVANAYDAVDAAARASLDGVGPPPEPIMPAGNKIPPPTLPQPMGAPEAVTPDEVVDVEATQRSMSDGDHGKSLRDIAEDWTKNGDELQADAEKFHLRIHDWEGEAADQAYAKFREFGDWLTELGRAWHDLAAEAGRISEAHVKALLVHTPVYQQYVALRKAWMDAAAHSGGAAHNIATQMERLQKASEGIITDYAGEAAPYPVTPATPPPSSGVPTVPVTSNGAPHTPPRPDGGNAGGAAGGGGGQARQGDAAQPRSASPLSTGRPANGSSPGGSPSREGAPAGGSPSAGGSPAGGGSSSGAGSPSNGTPSGPRGPATNLPSMPDDPRLSPAAASAGGAGGGAGGGVGGGAGGGSDPMPLQPNVGGVAVGPATGGSAVAGTPGGAGPGGSAGAGMGGMPMGGHGQGQGGAKEKRRTPGLTPDEDIYTEERPWTEPIIGNRRRKDVHDSRGST